MTKIFPFASLFSAVVDIVNKVIPDPVAKSKIMLDLEELKMRPDFAQIEVNKAEAASASAFVAGWRPGLAWVCVVGIAFAYIVSPIMSIYMPETHLPHFPIEHMENLVYSLLGLGAMRSYEKVKGVSK